MVSARRESENRRKYRLGGELARFSLDQLSDEALWGMLDEARERAKNAATLDEWKRRGTSFRPIARAERRAVIVKFQIKPPADALAQLRRFSLHYNSVRREWSGRVAIDRLAALRELATDLGGTIEELADAVARGRSTQLIQVSLPHALTPDEAKDLHRLGLRWSPTLQLYEGVADLARAEVTVKKWNGRAAPVSPGEVIANRYPVEMSVRTVLGLRCEIVWSHPPAPEIVEQLPVLGAEMTSATTAAIEVNGNIMVLLRMLERDFGDPELRELQRHNPPAR